MSIFYEIEFAKYILPYRLNSAINKVQDAINGEETYPYTSLNKIKEIIEDL